MSKYLQICLIFVWGSISKLWWHLTAEEVIVYHKHVKGGAICKIRNGYVYYNDRWLLMTIDGHLSGGDYALGLRWTSL